MVAGFLPGGVAGVMVAGLCADGVPPDGRGRTLVELSGLAAFLCGIGAPVVLSIMLATLFPSSSPPTPLLIFPPAALAAGSGALVTWMTLARHLRPRPWPGRSR